MIKGWSGYMPISEPQLAKIHAMVSPGVPFTNIV